MTVRARWMALAAILALAAGTRIGAIAVTQNYHAYWDALDYHAHALTLKHEHRYPGTLFAGLDRIIVTDRNLPPTLPARPTGPTSFRPPTWPYLLAASYVVGGESYTSGRLTNAALGVLAVLLIFVIAQTLWGPRVAVGAGAIAAVAPPLVYLNASIMSEPLFIALELGAVVAALLYGRSGGKLRFAVAAGVLCGLCALTRANGVVVLLAVALGVWMMARRTLPGPPVRARALIPVAAVLIAALLTIAPWTVRNTLAMGQVVPISTQAGLAIAGSYNARAKEAGLRQGWLMPFAVPELSREVFRNPALNEAEGERELRRRGIDFALDHPGYVLGTTWWNSLRMFELAYLGRYNDAFQQERFLFGIDRDLSRIATYVLALLALLGAAALLRLPPDRRGPLFMWLIPVLLFASTVPINGSPRYRAVIDPFLVLLAAVALVEGLRLVRERQKWPRGRAGAVRA